MRLIARRHLIAYGAKHPEARIPLTRWWQTVEAASWANTNDVAASASKAKVLNSERVRFEIAGGDYRLIAAFGFRRQVVFLKFIGTHTDYDRVDALTVSLF